MQPKNFITTYKKHRFSPLEPKSGDIDIEDIAHALSLMCRANGHFNRFFSVARHCINCCREGMARNLNIRVCLMLLLHDACEAYISDITRPVKSGLPEYEKIEEQLQKTIWEKFGLFPDDGDLKKISEIDDMMLKLEFACFADEHIDIAVGEPKIPPEFSEKAFKDDERDYFKLFNKLMSDFQ